MSQNLLLEMISSLDGISDIVKQDYVYIHPNIPLKKLNNAIESYANSDIKPEDVMILLDDSVFGSAKDGVLLTKDFIFAKLSSNKPVFFKIDNIKTIDSSGLVYATLNINGNKVFAFNKIGKVALKEFCKVVEIYIEESKNIEDEKTDHTHTIDSHSSQELNHIQNSGTQHLTKESNNDNLLLKMVSALDGTHPLVTQDKLYVHPNIPAKKIRNALDSYVHNVKPEDVMVLLDDTLFGSGSDGVALTKKGIFIKPNNSRNKYFFDMDCIKTIAADGVVLINLVINGSEKLPDFNQIGKSTLKAFCEFVTLYLRESRQVNSNTVNIKTNQQNETKKTSSFNESIVSDLNNKNIEPEKEIKIEKDLSKLTEDELFNEAELGDAEAQFQTGCKHWNEGAFGKSRKQADVNAEFEKSAYWFKKAAAQNHSGAMSRLGGYYENGVYGVEKNIDKALELYQKAARLEDSSAQSILGEIYSYGKYGVTQSYDMAIEWFEKAFKNIQNKDVKVGDKYSGINERLGDIYRHLGNYDKAIQWYEKYLYSYSSAEKVGNLYFELGNYEKALEYFTQPKIKQDSKYVVSNGMFSISGKLHLGIMYYDGKGAEQNHTIAFDYLEKAIDAFTRFYADSDGVIIEIDSDKELEEFSLNKDSVHDKFHRTLILSGFCFLKIAKISLNSSFFPKPIKC